VTSRGSYSGQSARAPRTRDGLEGRLLWSTSRACKCARSSTALSIKCVGTWRWQIISAETSLDGVLDARGRRCERARSKYGRPGRDFRGTDSRERARRTSFGATQAERLTEEMRALASDLPSEVWLRRRARHPPACERALLREREDAIGYMCVGSAAYANDDAGRSPSSS